VLGAAQCVARVVTERRVEVRRVVLPFLHEGAAVREEEEEEELEELTWANAFSRQPRACSIRTIFRRAVSGLLRPETATRAVLVEGAEAAVEAVALEVTAETGKGLLEGALRGAAAITFLNVGAKLQRRSLLMRGTLLANLTADIEVW